MSNKTDIIFSNIPCPSEDILLQYAKGVLNDKERRLVEEHLTDCEMCNDEIEGLLLLNNPEDVGKVVIGLNTNIDTYLQKEKKGNYGFFFKIAATIILILGLSVIVYYQVSDKKDQQFIVQNIPVDKENSKEEAELKETNDVAKKSELVSGEKEVSNKIDDGIAEEIPIKNIDQPQTIVLQAKDAEGKQFKVTGDRQTTVTAGLVKGTAGYANYKTDAITGDVNADKFVAKDETVKISDSEKEEEKNEITTKTVSGTTVLEKTELAVTSGKKRNAKENKKESARSTVDDDGEFKPASPVYEAVANTEAPMREEDVSGGIYLFQEAIEKTKDNQYGEALAIFDSIPPQSEKDEKALFYKGVCYYKLNNPQKAFAIFKELVKNDKFEFYNEMRWYYALTLISLNKNNDAVKILEDIIESDSPYAPDASKELEKIK